MLGLKFITRYASWQGMAEKVPTDRSDPQMRLLEAH